MWAAHAAIRFTLERLQKSTRWSGIFPCYFHVSISIGTPESDLLSLSTPRRTKWTLVYCYSALRINNCLKRMFAIKVATTDDLRNKWKPSCAIDTFRGEQGTQIKEGRVKSMKNALHVQWYGKRHLSG